MSCHDAVVLPYAAYLRVYEPLESFLEPARSLWQVYADSPDRPRGARALAAEQAEALHRSLLTPPMLAPAHESRHAYVLRSGDGVFVCPWQTRLRSWLQVAKFRSSLVAGMRNMFVPEPVADQVELAFEQWKNSGGSLRTNILTSTWRIPPAWFVPFTAADRRLVLPPPDVAADSGTDLAPDAGQGAGQGDGKGAGKDAVRPGDHPCGPQEGRTTASAERRLTYVASLADTRPRVEWAIGVVRGGLGDGTALSRLLTLAEWLSGFHPYSLVELDYGGLVGLLDDEALRRDESVTEVSAALTAMDLGQAEMTVAMHRRLTARWRAVRALATAN